MPELTFHLKAVGRYVAIVPFHAAGERAWWMWVILAW